MANGSSEGGKGLTDKGKSVADAGAEGAGDQEVVAGLQSHGERNWSVGGK